MRTVRVRVADIVVGDRARASDVDIESLAASIGQLGLMQPISLRDGTHLVFGYRRLQAVRSLGWTEVDAVVLEEVDDAVSALRAELDENVERVPFTPTEAARLLGRVRDLTRPARMAHKSARDGDTRGADGRFGAEPAAPAADIPAPPLPRTVEDTVFRATGYSATTLKRVARIATFVDTDDPAVAKAAQAALAAIDEGAKVKPLLDRVVDTDNLRKAEARYPVLAEVGGDDKHKLRVAEQLDEIAASGTGEALEAELRTIEQVWTSPSPAADPAAHQRSYALADRTAAAVKDWDSSSGGALLAEIASALTPASSRRWRELAQQLARIAGEITRALPD